MNTPKSTIKARICKVSRRPIKGTDKTEKVYRTEVVDMPRSIFRAHTDGAEFSFRGEKVSIV